MNLAQIFFLLFILLKPFYILPSGSLQLGDLMILGSFAILMFNRQIKLNKIDIPVLLFAVLVMFVNSLHMLINNGHISFVSPILFYVFSFITVLVFRTLAKDKQFLFVVSNVLKIGVLIQMIIFIFGIGRYYGSVRYMGTFNDPNQMGFFLISSVVLILLISEITKKHKYNFYFVVIAIYLIFETASTGMLLAIVFSLVPYYLLKIKKLTVSLNYKKILIIIPIIGVLGLGYIQYNQEIISVIKQTDLFKRVEEKFEKASNENNGTRLIEERGIDRLIKYPEYAVLGAGDGMYYQSVSRFPESFHQGEIHSTFPNILFNFGIIGLSLIIYWIYQNIKKLPLSILVLYIGIFIESFTLVNQRQPFFWMMIILGFCITQERNVIGWKNQK